VQVLGQRASNFRPLILSYRSAIGAEHHARNSKLPVQTIQRGRRDRTAHTAGGSGSVSGVETLPRARNFSDAKTVPGARTVLDTGSLPEAGTSQEAGTLLPVATTQT